MKINNKNEVKYVPWNFSKFLLDGNGKVINYYCPDVCPNEMIKDIERLLKNWLQNMKSIILLYTMNHINKVVIKWTIFSSFINLLFCSRFILLNIEIDNSCSWYRSRFFSIIKCIRYIKTRKLLNSCKKYLNAYLKNRICLFFALLKTK